MAERAGLGGGHRQMFVPTQSRRAISVSRGDLVRVIDIEGHQVRGHRGVDTADHSRWLSVSHTRDRCEQLFPAVGGQFCDPRGTPVLEQADDTPLAPTTCSSRRTTGGCTEPGPARPPKLPG